MQRALLTGITGFLGSHLARHLLAAGTEVHGVVRPGARLDRIPDLQGRVVLHIDDQSQGALPDVVEAAAPEVCFHLATRFVAEHGPADPGLLVVDNVAFPTRLADALATRGRIRFVNVGTAWQHVAGEPYRPKSLYAATKQAFEDVLRFYEVSGRLDTTTVKLYDTYGPLDQRGKLVSALARAAVTGESIEMSSGSQLVDLVHADDVSRALVHAAQTAGGGGTYALSSRAPLTVRQLVDAFGEVAGRPIEARWGARADRADEMLEHWGAGPALPGWTPEVPLTRGLGELLAEARQA